MAKPPYLYLVEDELYPVLVKSTSQNFDLRVPNNNFCRKLLEDMEKCLKDYDNLSEQLHREKVTLGHDLPRSWD